MCVTLISPTFKTVLCTIEETKSNEPQIFGINEFRITVIQLMMLAFRLKAYYATQNAECKLAMFNKSMHIFITIAQNYILIILDNIRKIHPMLLSIWV